MRFIKKLFPLIAVLFLAACAADKSVPLPDAAAVRPKFSPPGPITDPEQGLKQVIDAYRSGNNEAALRAALQLRESYPESLSSRRSLFVTEQVWIRMDDPSEAEAAMLRVQAEYPEMADYALSILADYHFAKARFSRAAALFQDLCDRYPKSSLAARAAFERGQALLESCSYAAAADVFSSFLDANSRSEFAPDAALGLARALLSDLRTDDAVRAYRDLWVNYPGTPQDQEAARTLAMLSASDITVAPWTNEELYERARNLYRTGQYEPAAAAFGRLLELDPKSVHRPEALFRLGLSQFNAGRRADAAAALQKLAREYPKDTRTPEALYWTAKSYFRLGDRDRAIRTLRKIVSSYGGTEWADDALFLIGNICREANDMQRAIPVYRRLATEYPQSRYADSATWWIAWTYYGAGKYRKADQSLQELIDRYPRSFLVHQARYWQGRIAEKTGNKQHASDRYRKLLKHGAYTYYGYRGSERLAKLDLLEASPVSLRADSGKPECPQGSCSEEDPLASFDSEDGPPVWTEETRQLFTREPSFRKTLELMRLDMKKEAAAELWFLQGRLPRKRGVLIGLSKAFFELGDYHRSLILVLRNYERYLEGEDHQVVPDLWLLAYPQGYWDSILAYARQYGQDPYFIAAVIREESQFHAEALSPAGARGVMQVMPSTGEWIAQAIRLPRFDRSKLFESDTAINLGTWYISHLMKRFKGDPLLVAAAYNAGPDAVSNWLSKTGRGVERDVFVETIPFAETRGYVKKVLRNYFEYKRIYGKKAGVSSVSLEGGAGMIGPLITDEPLTGGQNPVLNGGIQ